MSNETSKDRCCAGTEDDLCTACQVPWMKKFSVEQLQDQIEGAQFLMEEQLRCIAGAVELLRRRMAA